ncbi:MAG: CaiB/BaiF CoA transferase family protein [Clostridiaceae bacterium]
MKLPLEGIKVVELGTHVVVPNATRFLADWGAEVIKVEGINGEGWRSFGKATNLPSTDDENPLFTVQNANKKFIAIDLKTPYGMDMFKKLVSQADIFVTNVRGKSIKKLKIDYDNLKKINEKLIYCHFTGYGQEGPDADRPGFDLATFWARTGPLVDWVNPGDYPFRPSSGFGDAVTSAALTSGILAALFARERSGKGTFVTSSLYNAGIWYGTTGIVSAQECYGNDYPKSKLQPLNPFSHMYQCKDGEYLLTANTDYEKDYERMCTLLELEEYIGNEKYSTIEGVRENTEEFVGILNDKYMQKTRDEWVKHLSEADVVCEKCVHMKDVTKDEQAWANGYLKNVTFPSGNTAVLPTVPVQFSEYKTEAYEIPGAVGRDTFEIMKSLGYTEKDFEYFSTVKAIK